MTDFARGRAMIFLGPLMPVGERSLPDAGCIGPGLAGALGPLWHSGLTAATPACHARERR